MSDTDHILERRAQMLASKLSEQRDLLVQSLAPSGQRPPFTQQLSKPQALNWWRAHRYDDLGQKVLSNMAPESVLELDAALGQANEGFNGTQAFGTGPVQ